MLHYTHPPFTYCFLHYHYVGQQSWIVILLYTFGLLQLLHFLESSCSLVFSLFMLPLGDKLKLKLDCEMMTHYVRVYFRNIIWCPCE